MTVTTSIVWLTAAALLLHCGCDMPGQNDKFASGLKSTQTHPRPNASASVDTIFAIAPKVTYEMPPRRGIMLADLADFRQLAALLPDSLPGMKRENLIAERALDDSVIVSMALASYADAAGNNIEIKITDSGNLNLFAASLYPWLAAEMRFETESGYERTASHEGYRSFERYEARERSGEMYIAVGERYLVEVTGYGVLREDLKNAAGQINLQKLEAMPFQNPTGRPLGMTGQ